MGALSSQCYSVKETMGFGSSTRNPYFPKRIILIRHGQSLGNTDECAYCTIPDWKIPLTDLGIEQSREMGKALKAAIRNEPISIYVSPYVRTKQTLEHMKKELTDNTILSVREDPRLTEQQFGNLQDPNDMKKFKKDRNTFGRFYYRFPNGESGLDVYTRVSSFIGTIFREWSKDRISNGNVVIITHGLTLRLFLMRWFQYTVEEFEHSTNPSNATLYIMEHGQVASSKSGQAHHYFQLEDDCRDSLNLPRKSDHTTMETLAPVFKKTHCAGRVTAETD